MKKVDWQNPRLPFCSTVLVTTYDRRHDRTNIIAVSDILVCCYKPLYIAMCIRPKRYSHNLIMPNLEFCINLPSSSLLKQVDLCGNCSGLDTNKFQKFGLTPIRCQSIEPDAIAECYGHIECRIENPFTHIIHLGDHTVFIGKVVNSWADKDALDENGQVKIEKVKPIIYVARQREMGGLGRYFLMGEKIGEQGFLVKI